VKKLIPALIAAICLSAALATAAEARTVSYKGKTRSGNTITFARSGVKISRLVTMVPTVCLPVTGGTTAGGADLFRPTGSLAVGRTEVRKQLQKTALYYSKVTKYKVTTRSGRNGAMTGKLHMSFSYAYPIISYYGSYYLKIYICSGDSTFTARPR
jgi:hypothetical protein